MSSEVKITYADILKALNDLLENNESVLAEVHALMLASVYITGTVNGGIVELMNRYMNVDEMLNALIEFYKEKTNE